MLLRLVLIACGLLAATSILSAQQYEKCASHLVIEQMDAKYPGYKAATDAATRKALEHAEYAKTIRQQSANKRGRAFDTIYRIPVVVHILYGNAAQNLGDSVVLSQIDVLNKAFRKRNADTALTRPEFKGIAADMGIEFYLASTDPQGNSTTGITRTSTNGPSRGFLFGPTPLGSEDEKYTAFGGQDAWPTDQYLNIWVCNLAGGFGVLGYAYPPVGNLPQWPAGAAPNDPDVQGVVVYYKVFGSNNPNGVNDPLYRDLATGMTTVHEVGHYLGLRHIWGDGNCNEDDFVFDTPPASSASQQSCDYNKNTCVCFATRDLPDNMENYMDYSIDSCLNMFTIGQADLARSNIALYRNSLPERVLDTIFNPENVLVNTDLVGNVDSIVLFPGYSVININGQVFTFNPGDTIYVDGNAVVLPTCDSVVIYLGSQVLAAGDTLAFNAVDSLSSFDNGSFTITRPSGGSQPRPTGMDAFDYANRVSVYPNPGNGSFVLANYSGKPATEVVVYSLLGEVVWQTDEAANGQLIDLTQAPDGLYLVKALVGGQSVVKKVMKQQ